MADVIGPRITGMQHDVDEIKRHMESIGNRNSGNSHVRIDAGGVGVWAAVTACMVMLALNAVIVVMYVDLNRKYDSMKDYVHTTYMLVPQLKEAAKKLLDEPERK